MLETLVTLHLFDSVMASAPFTRRNLEFGISQPLVLSLGAPTVDAIPKFTHPVIIEHKRRKTKDSEKDLLSPTRIKDENLPKCSQFSYFLDVHCSRGYYKPQLTSLSVLESASQAVPGDIFALDISGKYADPSHAVIAKYRVMFDQRTRLWDINLRTVFAVEQNSSDPLVEICVDTALEENRVYTLLFGRTKGGDIVVVDLHNAEASSLRRDYTKMEKIASGSCVKFVRLDWNPSLSDIAKHDISPYNCYALMRDKKWDNFWLVPVDDLFLILDGELSPFKYPSSDSYKLIFPADGGYYDTLGISTMVKGSVLALAEVYARGGNSSKINPEFAVLTPNEILHNVFYQTAASCDSHVSAANSADNFNFATSPDDEPYILYGNEDHVVLAKLER